MNKTYKLGELIELCDERNAKKKYTVDDVKGISIQKIFIETKADMKDVSLNPYILVKPDYFAYVTVTSRNGEKITLAHNTTDNTYIVSSSYVVFSVKNKDLLLSDYLFMYFNRPEFDRYARFNSWGSARETFSWEDMCDMEIELPPLPIQQKYVDVYNAMLANQQSYERGLDDLKLVCDAYIEDLRRRMPCEAIGKYITQTKTKNDLAEKLTNKSVSNMKMFIDAKDAIINGVDTKNYLIVENNDFAYNTVTTRNADKLSIALNRGYKCLVSPLYTTFKVIDEKLLPKYLCLWFNRAEYDRYSRFNSWGSARELFAFDTLSESAIPIPDLKIQRDIVSIFEAYYMRKKNQRKAKNTNKRYLPDTNKGQFGRRSVRNYELFRRYHKKMDKSS